MNEKEDLPTGVLERVPSSEDRPQITYRVSGDRYILMEYGEMKLDLALNVRIHAMKRAIDKRNIMGVNETIPGVRSLLIKYDSLIMSPDKLISKLKNLEELIPNVEKISMPSRTITLPIAFNAPAIEKAVEKYKKVVREDAPNLPNNLEFFAKINGLSVDEVKEKILNTELLVIGLGDVFLGTPLLIPKDPRTRMITPKYDPARTWTPEGAVGWGGSTLCIYAAETPGGYQLLGRTVPNWDANQKNSAFDKPWLFRYYDKVQFEEVSDEELIDLRQQVQKGTYEYKISENEEFDFGEYLEFKKSVEDEAAEFRKKRDKATDEVDYSR